MAKGKWRGKTAQSEQRGKWEEVKTVQTARGVLEALGGVSMVGLVGSDGGKRNQSRGLGMAVFIFDFSSLRFGRELMAT